MRKLLANFSLIALSMLSIGMAVDGFAEKVVAQQIAMPYDAFVLQDRTRVYCGPGGDFYPTHELNQGAMVKVYRHDPGGWCAIRPPEKSFSLIPESAVKMLTENIGEVLADDTQTWVGTLLGPVDKPLPQVKVDRGERVFVIGEVAWPHPSGTTNVWYQIEPPAGEFHWIRMSEIQLPPDDRPVVKTPDPKSEPERALPMRSDSRPVNFEAPIRDRAVINQDSNARDMSSNINLNRNLNTNVDANSGWRTATKPIPQSRLANNDTFGTNEEYSSDNRRSFDASEFGASGLDAKKYDSPNYDTRANDRIDTQPAPRFASLENMNSQVRSFNATPAPASTTARNRPNATSLIELEDRLSQEIIKDYQQWKLADIKFDTQRLYQLSNDPVERMALQRVMEKIAKFETLREGFQSTSTMPDFGDRSARPFGSGIDPSVELGATYDATGILKQLASSSGSIDPTYVLQDRNGKVTHHVAGSAGLNLNRYLNQNVGIVGRRGYNRRLNLSHVTADRIIVLRR